MHFKSNKQLYLHILLLSVLYFCTGRLALIVAAQPGFATAIFPPAGIAVGFMLVFGYRVLPGVFIGSLLMNLSLSAASIGYSQIASSLFISLGACLQAYVSSYLIYKLRLYPNPLDNGWEIAKLLIIAGPLSCLINSILGTTILFAYGIIPADYFLFNWANWWVGDTIGVFSFLPLVIVWFARPVDLWKPRRMAITIPLVTAFIVSVVFFTFSSKWQNERNEFVLEEKAQHFYRSLESQLASYENILISIKSFYRASKFVSRDEFHTFTKSYIENVSAIQALEWAPVVKKDKINQFTAAAKKDGYEGFFIKEKNEQNNFVAVADRKLYYPVYYVEPYLGNQQALGFDLGSNAKRFATIQKSLNSGKIVATQRINLVQDEGKKSAFLLLLPVYFEDLEDPSYSNKKGLYGFIVGVIRVADYVAASKIGLDQNLKVEISDVTDDKSVLLYESKFKEQENKLNYFNFSGSVMNVFGRKWKFQLSSTKLAEIESLNWISWVILIGTLLLTSLLSTFLLIVSGRNSSIEQKVEEKTNKLQKLNQELQQATEVKSMFLANMSHEIRTPMNGILGVTDILSESLKQKEDLNNLKVIQKCGSDLLSLINDILDFSKIESGKLLLEQKPFSLRELVSDSISICKPKSLEKNVILITDFQKDNPDWLIGDPIRVKQVLVNLISNAIKFTKEGEVKISVDSKLIEDRKFALHFAIKDNGIGITPEASEKLFQSFSQVDASTTRKYGGTGLGLAICKGICESMGGKIWVESELDIGSIFHFTAVLEKSYLEQDTERKVPKLKLNKEIADKYPMQILVVEDNIVNLKVVLSYLKKMGYQVDTVQNGRLAVEAVDQKKYDLIFMDCQMPEMDGFEATRIIRSKYNEDLRPYIVALTAGAMKEEKDNCFQAGMDDFLSKPLVKKSLFLTIVKYGNKVSLRAIQLKKSA